MEVKIINTLQEFRKIRQEWNRTVRRSSSNLFFLTFEWLSSWLETFGGTGDLFVILIYDPNFGGRIIGAAPLMIKKNKIGKLVLSRKLQFIGNGPSDYVDFIIVDKKEECFHLFLNEIKKHLNLWDWAEFSYLPSTSFNFGLWINYQENQWSISKDVVMPSVFINLVRYRGWQNYFKTLDPKHRKDIRRQENNIKKLGIMSFETINDGKALRKMIPTLLDLHNKRWRGINPEDRLMYRDLEKAYSLLIEETNSLDIVEISCLKINNEIASMVLAFVYNGRYYYYKPTFNIKFEQFSPGKILLKELIHRSFKEKLIFFDLLAGGEKYKFLWTDEKFNLYSIFFFKKSFTPQVIYRYKQLYKFLRRYRIVKYLYNKIIRVA